ncbi:MAG: hypothetical protein HWN68_05975 [Desulfobacterales bacterium]|nr:hypothetical protein [Desulfobacterales bacterium]
MAQFKGYEGSMKFDVAASPTAIGNAHVYGVTIAGDTVEITDFTSTGWKKFLATLKSWSVTGEAFWDETDPAQAALRGAVGGAEATIQCFTGDAGKAYHGEGIVTAWDVGAAVDGVITASFTLQGTDALSYSVP